MRQLPNGYPALRRTGVAFGLAAAGMLLVACGSGRETPVGNPSASERSVPTSPPTRSARVAPSIGNIVVNPHVVLTAANYCTWRFGTHPMPLSSRDPVKIRIDDRCNLPADSNPKTDKPTGVYSGPEQTPSTLVTKIPDGTQVTVGCYTTGEAISDAVGNTSTLWLAVATPDGQSGMMPDVNVGGGYDPQQLHALGLDRCR